MELMPQMGLKISEHTTMSEISRIEQLTPRSVMISSERLEVSASVPRGETLGKQKYWRYKTGKL